jgi:phosphoglucosamine mutase
MISASHNPFYDNGIKLIGGNGCKIDATIEQQIEAYIDGDHSSIPLAKREEIVRTVDYSIGRNRYVGYLISLATRSFKDKKVGLDLSNGSATTIAKGVFDALGAKTYVMGSEHNGVNINKDVGSTHIKALQRFVTENALDVGFAYDGDADRCICVDEKGNVVDGDGIMYICARYLKGQGELTNNTVVATVMSNLGFFKALEELGIGCAITAVGDKNVHDYMTAHDNCLGGEQSGHIIFSRYASTGDGILTSLKIMEVMIAKEASLSKLTEGLVKYPQILVNLRVNEEDKERILNDPEILEVVKKVEKQLRGEGRILLRKSGTEPVIRIMAAAESEEKCGAAIELGRDALKNRGFLNENG